MSESADDILDLLGERPSDAPLVRTAELAEFLGLTSRRLAQLASDGILKPKKRGYYDLKAATRAYVTFLRERAKGQAAADEKARLVKAQADKHELANAKARGELVSLEAVKAEWAAICVDLRAKMLALPARVQARAALDNHTTGLIDAEVRLMLEGLADDA